MVLVTIEAPTIVAAEPCLGLCFGEKSSHVLVTHQLSTLLNMRSVQPFEDASGFRETGSCHVLCFSAA